MYINTALHYITEICYFDFYLKAIFYILFWCELLKKKPYFKYTFEINSSSSICIIAIIFYFWEELIS
jgi:hypothetical protein